MKPTVEKDTMCVSSGKDMEQNKIEKGEQDWSVR